MSTIQDESLMRAAFAPARTIEPSEAEIARVVAGAARPLGLGRSSAPPIGWRRLAAPGLAALAVLAGSASHSATRATIDDVAGTAGWIRGEDSAAPGSRSAPTSWRPTTSDPGSARIRG